MQQGQRPRVAQPTGLMQNAQRAPGQQTMQQGMQNQIPQQVQNINLDDFNLF